MNHYAQINDEGICVGVLETSSTVDATHMIPVGSLDQSLLGKKYENGNFVSLPELASPTVWTVLAFRSRFTEAEKRAIYAARANSIDIQIWLDDLAAAEDVRSDDLRMIAGVQGLEAAGLLAAGRAAEIMGSA